MRIHAKLLCGAATLTALGCASCGSTAPARTSVAGHWTGHTVVGPEQWLFDMTLTTQGDSVGGQATVRSLPARFTDGYFVTGTTSGDSVHLLLRPVEDADIHIVAGVTPGQLAGSMWMNNFVNDTHAIEFERQSTP